MKSKIKYLSLIIVTSLLISGCTIKKNQEKNLDLNTTPTPEAGITTNPTTTMTQNNPIVSLKTKNGEILIKLYQNEAPNTVANFIQKANSGYYDNLIFHRVEPGFVAQGGDPQGTGYGGGSITSEINQVTFKRGSVGLARGGNINISNDSQFFICLADQTCNQLTGLYVNFGEVISGLDIVDQIKIGDKIISITSQTK
jgi:cyclophilin family peptidyl-prolyl cis-trans isomerase